jgi:hypothetical protein
MKRPFSRVLALCAVTLALASCATSVSMRLMKPPTLPMLEFQKVAMLPAGFTSDPQLGSALETALFRYSTSYRYRSREEEQVAQTLTNAVTTVLLDTKAYTVVSPDEVKRTISSGASVALAVDAYLCGEISFFNTNEQRDMIDVKGPDGTMRKEPVITRTVDLEYYLRVIRASDGAIVGQIKKHGTASDRQQGPDSWSRLRSSTDLARQIISSTTAYLNSDLAAHSVMERRVLAKDATKDPRMKEAEELVKGGSYKDALAAYQAVYAGNGNFAAGYNAALMIEILGDLPGAIDAMSVLASASGNPKAANELNRMRRSLADKQALGEL